MRPCMDVQRVFVFFKISISRVPETRYLALYEAKKNAQIREKSFLGHFCHHFLNIKGNGKEDKVHIDLVYAKMAKTIVRHIVFNLPENSFRLDASPASIP